MTIQQFLKKATPPGCEAVRGLYSWSLNHDPGKGPFTLFIDMIGWSETHIGERLYEGIYPIDYIDSVSLAYALIAYAHRPDEVMVYVNQLMDAEREES